MRCHTNVSKSLKRVSLVQHIWKQASCLLQLLLLLYQLSSWLICPLGKSIILVIGESPTTIVLECWRRKGKYEIFPPYKYIRGIIKSWKNNHQVILIAWGSLALSLCLSSITLDRSSRLHPVSAQGWSV